MSEMKDKMGQIERLCSMGTEKVVISMGIVENIHIS